MGKTKVVKVDPAGLIDLTDEETVAQALFTARYRELPVQDALDALLLAGYYIPSLPSLDEGAIRDAGLAVGLEKIQWQLMLALSSEALELFMVDYEQSQANNLVHAVNMRMGDMLPHLIQYAAAQLIELSGEFDHPVTEAISDDWDRNREDSSLLPRMTGHLVLSALARVQCFIRATYFHLAVFSMLNEDKNGDKVFDNDQLLPSLHKNIKPLVVLDDRFTRVLGNRDGKGDEQKPNLALEGWYAPEYGSPEKNVWFGFFKRGERTTTLVCATEVIRQGGYPLESGQRLAPDGLDFHVLPFST